MIVCRNGHPLNLVTSSRIDTQCHAPFSSWYSLSELYGDEGKRSTGSRKCIESVNLRWSLLILFVYCYSSFLCFLGTFGPPQDFLWSVLMGFNSMLSCNCRPATFWKLPYLLVLMIKWVQFIDFDSNGWNEVKKGSCDQMQPRLTALRPSNLPLSEKDGNIPTSDMAYTPFGSLTSHIS
jgi:hypothetical protein